MRAPTSRRASRRAGAAILGAGLLVLSGCGLVGGDKEEPTSERPFEREVFLRQVTDEYVGSGGPEGEIIGAEADGGTARILTTLPASEESLLAAIFICNISLETVVAHGLTGLEVVADGGTTAIAVAEDAAEADACQETSLRIG
jgi:hypothetical protein